MESLDTIILRQPTRKQWLLNPAWGRLAYSAEFGHAGKKIRRTGPAVLLEASILLRCGSGVEISALQILSKSIVLENTVTLFTTPETDFSFIALWNPPYLLRS